MYGWIWKRLPGPVPVRIIESLLLVAAVVWVLFFYVFPVLEPMLPFNDVTTG